MKKSRIILVGIFMFFGFSEYGLSENANAQQLSILSPKIQNEIIKVSGADSISSVNTIVFRKIGSSSILVVECSLIIASIEKKTVPEDVMHSRFTFISRNGSELIYEKADFPPRKILENEFILPTEKQ